MRLTVRAGFALPCLICILSSPIGAQTLPPAVALADAQKQENQQVCDTSGSELAKQNCDQLGEEFYVHKNLAKMRIKHDGSPDLTTVGSSSLLDPTTVLLPFIASTRKKAFEDLTRGKLTKDEQSAAESFLNAWAQKLSTKASVNQTGANSSASASTNLVQMPTTSDLISLAAESGAFTETQNGNSITAQVNADGLRRYLSNKPFTTLSPGTIDILQHLTVAATMSIAQASSSGLATTGTATTSTPSLSSVLLPANDLSFNAATANLSLYRPYHPNSRGFNKNWIEAENANSIAIAKANSDVYLANDKLAPAMAKVANDSEFIAAQNTWLLDGRSDEKSGDFTSFVNAYKTYTDLFLQKLKDADPNFAAEMIAIDMSIQELAGLNQRILDAARGPLCTFAYTYSTPPNKPATHQATLSAAYTFKTTGRQITGNAAGTWFATVPAGAKYGRVQSYQFSGEYDSPMGGTSTSPKAVFTLAGYGQYQYSPTVLNITAGNLAPGTNITLNGSTQVLMGTAGWLGVAQSKLTFNIGQGLSIPVAVKWSNKTDLVEASNWKGQFGISYDFTAISSMLTGLLK